MAEKKQWDGDGVPIEDSNVAGIGSDEDKAARKNAAATEPAWNNVGAKPGIEVWRIENFKVVPWPKKEYGRFYSGDSYIILHTELDEDENGKETDKLVHTIHFWLGEKTSTDEMGTAAYKTVELDDLLDGNATQCRQLQEHESADFHEMFETLDYLEGGVDSGFHQVGEVAYEKKLIQVKRGLKHKKVRCKEVLRDRASLNHDDVFILDAGKKLYIWEGNNCQPQEKLAATVGAEKLEDERAPDAKMTRDIDDAFWEVLGGSGDIAEHATGFAPERTSGEGLLYKLTDSGEGEGLKMKEVAHGDFGASQLDSNCVMMVDTETEIFLWVGLQADKAERRNSMRTAIDYLTSNSRPKDTPITVFKEGKAIKNKVWKEIFKSGPKKIEAAAAPPPEPAKAKAAEAPVAEAQPGDLVLTLAELTDSDTWKTKGVDAAKREMYLSDAEFKEVFGVGKAEFEKLPGWKKTAQKKEKNLF